MSLLAIAILCATATDLTAALTPVIDSASPHWQIGIAIVSCSDESLAFAHNASRPLIPASGIKLLVTACALDNWNPALVCSLDRRLGKTPLQSHLHRVNRPLADSLGLDSRPDFAGYQHLALANRESANRIAEWMLELLARQRGCDGHRLIAKYLDRKGIPRVGLRVWDAAGLGHRNRVSPLTFAMLLSRLHNSPNGELFRSTLAVPQRPGTLINRQLDAGDRIAAKTGFIRGVFSLTGYLSTKTEEYAFSFILNNCQSGTEAYTFFNRLLNALDAAAAEQH